MNKDELVSHVASESDISKAAAAKAVTAVFAGIMDSCKKGEEVNMPGFGKFAVTHRAASEGRNPRTGEKIKIAATKQVKFRPGKGFKDHVNGPAKKK